MRKRFAAILLVFVMILSACARQPLEELPESDAVLLYDGFLQRLSGARITRLSVELDEPIKLMRPLREEILLAAGEDMRQMTYRAYNPLIFWNINPPDYYDGESYYYKYKDDWFIDHYGRFRMRLKPQFLGVPEKTLNRENILRSRVYTTAKGHGMEIVSENPNNGLVYTIEADMDHELYINKIEIRAHRGAENGKLAGYYSIRYSKRAENEVIMPPGDLELSEIEYLKQYYEEQARLVPAGAQPEAAEIAEE